VQNRENVEPHGARNIPLTVEVSPTSPSPEAEKREAEKAELDRKTLGYTFWLFLATFASAVATIVLSIVAFLQMRDARKAIDAARKAALATEKQVAISEREFIAAHRPRVILREAIVGPYLEGGPINVVFALANIGEAHATIFRSQVNLEVVGEHVVRPFFLGSIEPLNELGTIILEPGQQVLLNLSDKKRPPGWEPMKREPRFVKRDKNGSLTHLYFGDYILANGNLLAVCCFRVTEAANVSCRQPDLSRSDCRSRMA
jgi:hypothetical protein